jgi:predicted Zn-dependent peptidase
VFAVHAATEEEDVQELVAVGLDELEKAAATVSEDEVRRAAAQLKAGLLMARESSAARSGPMARHILYRGRTLPPEELVALIEAVDAAAVREEIARMLAAGLPTLAAVGPVARVPSAEEIAVRFGAPRRVANG